MLICYYSTEIKGYICNLAVQWFPKLVWKTIPALVGLQRNKKTRTCLWRFHKARFIWFKELPFLLRLCPSYHFSIHMAFLYKMLHIFKNYICKMQKSGYPCSRFSVLLSLLHPNSPPSSGLGKKWKWKLFCHSWLLSLTPQFQTMSTSCQPYSHHHNDDMEHFHHPKKWHQNGQ